MVRPKISRLALLPALSLLAVALAAASVARAQTGPWINHIEILVLSVPGQELLGTVKPGEILELPSGQTVRLRMSAVPAGAGPRYPSTRFTVVSGRARVRVEAANEEVGNVTLTAWEVRNRRNAREETAIQYQILDKLNIAPELRTGKIWIRVTEAPPPVAESGAPAPGPGFTGIILYEHEYYRGRSQNFNTGEVRALHGSAIGQDRASSLRIEPGCKAILYEHQDFRGRSIEVTGNVPDLGDTGVGNDSVSSLSMDCSERDRWARH